MALLERRVQAILLLFRLVGYLRGGIPVLSKVDPLLLMAIFSWWN